MLRCAGVEDCKPERTLRKNNAAWYQGTVRNLYEEPSKGQRWRGDRDEEGVDSLDLAFIGGEGVLVDAARDVKIVGSCARLRQDVDLDSGSLLLVVHVAEGLGDGEAGEGWLAGSCLERRGGVG